MRLFVQCSVTTTCSSKGAPAPPMLFPQTSTEILNNSPHEKHWTLTTMSTLHRAVDRFKYSNDNSCFQFSVCLYYCLGVILFTLFGKRKCRARMVFDTIMVSVRREQYPNFTKINNNNMFPSQCLRLTCMSV